MGLCNCCVGWAGRWLGGAGARPILRERSATGQFGELDDHSVLVGDIAGILPSPVFAKTCPRPVVTEVSQAMGRDNGSGRCKFTDSNPLSGCKGGQKPFFAKR